MSYILSDPGSERAVLAGICKYGDQAYYDIVDLLNDESFTQDSNKILYKCLKHLLSESNEPIKIDIPSVFSAANTLGLGYYFKQPIETEYLHAIMEFPIALENVRKFAKKIYKLALGRTLHKQLRIAQDKILELKGEETISDIINIAENTIFDFSALTDENNESYIKLGDKIEGYLKEVTSNPVSQIGLSTGFPRYDEAIGGGLRIGLNVIGARPKIGKSTFSMNVAHHVTTTLKIPTLYLDTEMMEEDQIPRWLGNASSVYTNRIECGTFTDSIIDTQSIEQVKEIAKKAPLFYRKIPGIPLEEQLSIMRRFHRKEVGKGNRGLIIYDYFQLTDGKDISSSMQEYQLLGFMMKLFSNFAVINEIPILMMLQLNRQYEASGSDRIVWLCTNFSKFLKKTDDEIASDGVNEGNRKLIVTETRYGEGMDYRDYINFHLIGNVTRLKEGLTKFELENTSVGFDTNHDHNNQVQF